MKTYISVLTILTAALSLAGDLGPLSHSFNYVSAVILITITTLTYFRFPKQENIKDFVTAIVLLVVVIFLLSLFISNKQMNGIFTIAIFCLIFALIVKEKDINISTYYSILAITIFIFGIIKTLYNQVSFIFVNINRFAESYSSFLGSLFNQNILFRATAGGIFIFVLYFMWGLIYILNTKEKKWLYFFYYILSLIFLNIAFILSIHLISQSLNHFYKTESFNPQNLQILLYSIYILPLILLLKKQNIKYIKLQYRVNLGNTILPIMFSVLLIILYNKSHIHKINNSNSSVFIYDKGHFNWHKPTYKNFGLRSSGMFGMLPLYLETMGFDVKTDTIINNSTIEKNSIIIIINLDTKLPSEEKKVIMEFVNRGGSLLILGDHTGLGGILEPLNDLAKEAGVLFNFDCGHYLYGGWENSFQLTYHPFFDKIQDHTDIGISVGASLKIINNIAKPVLYAKYGFSDIGNPFNKKMAYLGDRIYNQGEALGDIVLITETKIGQGKIIIFGDTSSFQNGQLAFSYQFVNNVMKYMLSKYTFLDEYIIEYFLYFLLFILFLILIKISFKNPIVILHTLFIIVLCNTFLPLFKSEEKISNEHKKLVYLDAAHFNKFTHYNDTGIWSLNYSLMRNDYIPIIYKNFDKNSLYRGKVAFFIAPLLNMNKKEVILLEDFIKQGNFVFWSTGYEKRFGSRRILDQFGFDFDNIPLGPIPKKNTSAIISFKKAWPIIVKTDASSVDTLCTGWDMPVIVSKRIGKGKFFLFSDPYFFLSANLENDKINTVKNIRYFKQLIGSLNY